MFAVFDASAHDANVLRGYLLADYSIELAAVASGASPQTVASHQKGHCIGR